MTTEVWHVQCSKREEEGEELRAAEGILRSGMAGSSGGGSGGVELWA